MLNAARAFARDAEVEAGPDAVRRLDAIVPNRLRDDSATLAVWEEGGSLPMKFHICKDSPGQFRWRLVAANNRTIADSGESYWNKTDCEAAIALVTSTNALTPVVDLPVGEPVHR